MKVFISYRRVDSEDLANHIAERLRQAFGSKNIFLDVNNIGGGDDFTEVIEKTLSRVDVVLILIGPKWVNVTDDSGNRRLNNPDDLVRREVELSLQRGKGVKVIPILLKDTPMPPTEELPPSLRGLSRLNAVNIHPGHYFDTDLKHLIITIRKSKSGYSPKYLIGGMLVLVVLGISLFLLSQQNSGGQEAAMISTTVTTEQIQETVSVPATTVMPVSTETSYPTETSSPTTTNTLTYTATAVVINNHTLAPPTSTQISTIVPSLTSTPEVTNTSLPSNAVVGFPCDASIISDESQVLNVVRTSPSDSSPAIIGVVPNESVIVIDISRQNSRTFWYQIGRSESEILGWIAPRYLVLSPLCPSQ